VGGVAKDGQALVGFEGREQPSHVVAGCFLPHQQRLDLRNAQLDLGSTRDVEQLTELLFPVGVHLRGSESGSALLPVAPGDPHGVILCGPLRDGYTHGWGFSIPHRG